MDSLTDAVCAQSNQKCHLSSSKKYNFFRQKDWGKNTCSIQMEFSKKEPWKQASKQQCQISIFSDYRENCRSFQIFGCMQMKGPLAIFWERSHRFLVMVFASSLNSALLTLLVLQNNQSNSLDNYNEVLNIRKKFFKWPIFENVRKL